MQPTLCSKCKKNVAVVFISRMNEKGEPVNEGLCLKCAAQLGLPQVEDMMKRMGITPDDLENLNSEMMQAFGGAEELGDVAQANEDGDEDEESGKTATFPFLNRLFGGNNNPPAEKGETPQRETGKESRKGEKKHKYLDNYCINLSRRAREGKLDAVIGREEEIQRVVQILNRRQKNNPCLIGEPGVGKTAIAEGLAQRIAAGEVPFKLRDKEVYLLDLTALVAGTQFRGQFESRMKGLIEEIRKLGNVILVIDEVHNIVGAGDAEGSMNAANILKPALSRGEIQVIGATTFNEYRKYIEKDTALERRFQPVTVAEPSIEDTLKILKGIAHYYETYHGVSIPEGVLRQAVLLSERYITDRFLPDKAIDLIDEACSDLNLKDPTINRRMEVKRDLENVTFERETLMSAEAPEGEELTEEQLDQRYARIAELRSQEMRLQEELTELEKKGVPQVTMENIARVIEMWTKIPASKIKEEEFKRLAELDVRLKQHIVGQDEAVQILDDGEVTDAHGRKVNFENTVIVMTSNAGSGKAAGAVGFGRSADDQDKERVMKALQEFLRPEFINRVDEIVYFHQLTEENFRGIAGIMLEELKAALEEKGYHFTYDDALVDYLVKKSYSAAYGARNLRRCIRKDVEDPMAARIIESYETPITQIKATAEDGAVKLYTL